MPSITNFEDAANAGNPYESYNDQQAILEEQERLEEKRKQEELNRKAQAEYDQEMKNESVNIKEEEKPDIATIMAIGQGYRPGVDPDSGNFEDIMSGESAVLSLALKGTLDTLKEGVRLVPWLKPVMDGIPDIPEEENEAEQTTRQLGGMIMSTMLLNTGFQGAAARLYPAAISKSKKLKYTGELMRELGVDSLVAYGSSASAKDDNNIKYINDFLGINLPGATEEGDTELARRKKHVYEAAGMIGIARALGVAIKLGKKIWPKGVDKASQEIVEKTVKTVDADQPVESAAKQVIEADNKVVNDETIRRMKAGPGGVDTFGDPKLPYPTSAIQRAAAKGLSNADLPAAGISPGQVSPGQVSPGQVSPGQLNHDPFIHKYSENHEKYVPNSDANGVEAIIDNAREQLDPTYPSKARAVPAPTEHYERDFMGITTPGDRKDALHELFTTTSASVDAVKDGKVVVSAPEIRKSIDAGVDVVYNNDISFDEYKQTVSGMLTNTYEGARFMNEADFKKSTQVFKKAFEEMFNPNNMRSSMFITKSAAANASDIARGASLIPNKNTANLQVLVMKKLELLASEIRANQYISGKALAMKKLATSDLAKKTWMAKRQGKTLEQIQLEEQTSFLETARTEFTEGLVNAKAEGLQTVKTYKEIAEKNPEFLRPFMEAVDATNGRVDTLEKLKIYANKSNSSFKQLWRTDDEAPSWFVKGLVDLRYNAMLSGTAAIKAMEGNIQGLVLKPMTVTLGAVWQRDGGQLQKALHTYAPVYENYMRALAHASSEWKFAIDHPQEAMSKGRVDLMSKQMDNFQIMEGMAEAWKKNGQMGKYYFWNLSKNLSGFNSNRYVRFGINAMYALDGFTNAMVMNANVRNKAFDFASSKASYKDKDTFNKFFKEYEQKVNDEYFNLNKSAKEYGTLKKELPEGVKYQAQELEFNLDDGLADWIGQGTNKIPLLKAIFAFPRTGINAIKYSWSFNPINGYIANAAGVGKMGKIFKAQTKEEIMDALALHGIKDYDLSAFEQIKSEYIGRQMVGHAVIGGAAMWAFNGNLRGNGDVDWSRKKAQKAIGFKPRTIKNPITGQWVSYENREPFTSILAAVGDIAYYTKYAGEDFGEDRMRKLSAALFVGPTSSSFLGGMGELADLLTGDTQAWNRFAANGIMAPMVPYSGAIGAFGRIVDPALNDVNGDIMEYIKNRHKGFIYSDEHLVNSLDIHTGEPINWMDPITAALNETALGFFFSNGGEEEWRMKLIESGYAGYRSTQTNKFTGQKLTQHERQFMNNWIAQNVNLVGQIEELFDENTGKGRIAMNSLNEWRENRGKYEGFKEGENSSSDIYLYNQLDTMYKEAEDMAFNALRNTYDENSTMESLKGLAAAQKQRGEVREGVETSADLSRRSKKYNKRVEEDYKEKMRKKAKKDRFGDDDLKNLFN